MPKICKCGSTVQDGAKFCVSCGQKQKPPTFGKFTRWFVGITFAAIAIPYSVHLLQMATDPTYAEEWRKEQASMAEISRQEQEGRERRREAEKEMERQRSIASDARYSAKEFVKRRLRAPSTASFSGLTETSVTKTKDGDYFVMGWVDSQNGFGAMIRSTWAVQMKDMGAKWQLVDVKIQ